MSWRGISFLFSPKTHLITKQHKHPRKCLVQFFSSFTCLFRCNLSISFVTSSGFNSCNSFVASSLSFQLLPSVRYVAPFVSALPFHSLLPSFRDLSFQRFHPVHLPPPFVLDGLFRYILPFVSTLTSRIMADLKKCGLGEKHFFPSFEGCSSPDWYLHSMQPLATACGHLRPHALETTCGHLRPLVYK